MTLTVSVLLIVRSDHSNREAAGWDWNSGHEERGYYLSHSANPLVSISASREPSSETALYKTWDLTSGNSYCLQS